MVRVIFVALGLAVGASGAAAQAPLGAYGNLPTIEQIAISPNGQLLAIDVVNGEQRTIVVQNIATKTNVVGLRAGETKIRRLEWAGDDHLIITASSTQNLLGVFAERSEWFVASDFNIAARKLSPLLGDIDYAGNMLDGYPIIRTVKGKPTVFATGLRFLGDEGQMTLFRVDLDSDHSYPVIDTGGEQSTGYIVDANGRPLALEQYDAPLKLWSLKVMRDGVWRQAEAEQASIETPELVGLRRDGKSILIGRNEQGAYVLRELTPDGVHLSDPLPGPSVGEVVRDPLTHGLIGIGALVGDDFAYHFYDDVDQREWRAILAAFPGQSVRLESMSDDRRRLILHVDSPTDGPGYALVDLNQRSTLGLGADYPALAPADISPVRAISFKAADGLAITGYLTVPNGRDPKKLPLVVFPHGGPAVRDEPGFDWWAQAMASRGYAVLQVNYRGSEGFGWSFMSAGFGEWGRKVQTDLSDGVRYLAAEGIIDPGRVCIVGASYGGYAALAGATLDTGVYRCAVDVSGPSDLKALIAWGVSREGRQGVGVARYWDRYMGAKSPDDPRLADISPASHADRVTIPILIIHGKDDTVVPFAQSETMGAALKKAGKPFDFVILNHEDHWLSRSATRLQMLQATIDFLAKNNPAS